MQAFRRIAITATVLCLVLAPLGHALDAPEALSIGGPSAEAVNVVELPKTESPKAAEEAPVGQEAIAAPVLAVAPPLQTQPAPVYAGDDVLVSAFRFRQNSGFDFIELHNTTTSMTKLDGMTIRLLYSTASTDYDCAVTPSGYMFPSSYVTYRQGADGTDGAYPMNGCPDPGKGLFDKEIQVWRDGVMIESVRIAESDMAGQQVRQWERAGWTSTYRTGTLGKDFKVSTRAALTSLAYHPPTLPSLQFLEVFPTPSTCAVGDMTIVCSKYVKVKNTGDVPIDLGQFRLRSGDPNTRSSTYNTSKLKGNIQPGEYAVIVQSMEGTPLAINGSAGTVWLEDAYGFMTYPNTVTPYEKADLVANSGHSWAYDEQDGKWKWAPPSPFTEQNEFTAPGKGEVVLAPASDLKPCAENQYRSVETNRCRSVQTSVSTPKPCKDGQYRSEETGRCRSIIATVASELKPCGDDQFRNPATGRCKKIASLDDVPKPCPEGQERNLSTNRCRKISVAAIPAAPFPVESVKDTAKAFAGWWALGGILALGAGYATWEWRQEIRRFAGRAVTVIRRK